MDIHPRLGPAQVTPEVFAHQAFRTSLENLNRLPLPWRGMVVTARAEADDVLARIDRGEIATAWEPNDVFLAYCGQEF